LVVLLTASPASAASEAGYYFDLANELIDLPYPGNEFYGEVYLTLLETNHVRVEANVYTNIGENDRLGRFIQSPIVPGSNFGIDKFGMNSTLIANEEDFNTFMTLYDVVLPDRWGCSWGGVAGELGKFELWDTGTGNSRVDPFFIEITAKDGVVIPDQFAFNSLDAFIELCPQGTYFAMHAAGFTIDSSYWREGASNPESSFFAVSPLPPSMVPEPGTLLLALIGLGTVVRAAGKQR